jgi:hypothetical protein
MMEAGGAVRARVNYAFNVICPRPADPSDARQAMMHSWLKARLYSIDCQVPFNFNPYDQ